jgi:hypothetical protein
MKHADEKPKRLTPTKDTLRELYLKSGNRCAFPGCHKALFNSKGVFVGQICHIEAAESGGQRFNLVSRAVSHGHIPAACLARSTESRIALADLRQTKGLAA